MYSTVQLRILFPQRQDDKVKLSKHIRMFGWFLNIHAIYCDDLDGLDWASINISRVSPEMVQGSRTQMSSLKSLKTCKTSQMHIGLLLFTKCSIYEQYHTESTSFVLDFHLAPSEMAEGTKSKMEAAFSYVSRLEELKYISGQTNCF